MKSTRRHIGGNLIKEPGHFKFTGPEALGVMLFSAALGIAGTLVVQDATSNKSPSGVTAYERTYTDPGKCLHDTPYDPSKAALVNETFDHASGEEMVIVLPQAANHYRPSVLLFNEGNDGHLIFSDYQTAAFLEAAHCQGLPDGS